MSDLFSTAGMREEPQEDPRPPTVEQYIRERLRLPREWRWVSIQAEGTHPDYWGQTVEGGVYPPKLTGKNKGKPNFGKGTLVRKMTVPDTELKAWLRTWEAEERRCYKCKGTGQMWAGWNHLTGDRREPCTRCRATGTPPHLLEPAQVSESVSPSRGATAPEAAGSDGEAGSTGMTPSLQEKP